MIALAAALLLAGHAVPPGLDTWQLANDGSDGVPDADVGASRAWTVTTGDRSVIVAVIDTGCDPNHPELADAIWTNPGEIPGNGIDDDGDGRVDDVHGWDFADGDPDTFDAFPVDHGTMVCGLIAGSSTGLAPGVTILPLKVFSDCGQSAACNPDFEAVAGSAMEFAIARGAKVIQIAWELSGPPGPALMQAFVDADAAGALTVIAAGNDGVDLDLTPVYPASIALPSILVVAASDRYDRLVDVPGFFQTNDGAATVGIAAPGEMLTSTFPGGGHFFTFTGTSGAAPIVSAAAALVWSANPSLSAVQVKQLLLDGADRLPGFDGKVAGGRLDAGNAVHLAIHPGAIVPAPPALVPVSEGAPDLPLVFDVFPPATGRWNFGDGAVAAAATAEHGFDTGGPWPATLELVDSFGLAALARETVSIPSRWTSTSVSIVHTQPLDVVAAPGARWMRLHFASIDASGGTLILADRTNTGLRSWQGTFSDVTTDPVGGDALVLELKGSGSFLVDRVDSEADGVADAPPIARVSGDVLGVRTGEAAAFDASASSDPDGDPISLAWRLVDAPAGSTAALTTTSGATTSIVPDRGGAYAISLTATDPYGASSSHLAWVVTRGADSSGGCEVAPGAAPAGSLLLLALAALVLRRSGR